MVTLGALGISWILMLWGVICFNLSVSFVFFLVGGRTKDFQITGRAVRQAGRADWGSRTCFACLSSSGCGLWPKLLAFAEYYSFRTREPSGVSQGQHIERKGFFLLLLLYTETKWCFLTYPFLLGCMFHFLIQGICGAILKHTESPRVAVSATHINWGYFVN